MVTWEGESRVHREPRRYDIFRFTPSEDTSHESLAFPCFFHGRLIRYWLSTRDSLPSAPRLITFNANSTNSWLTPLSIGLKTSVFIRYCSDAYSLFLRNSWGISAAFCFPLRHSSTSYFEIHKLTGPSKVSMYHIFFFLKLWLHSSNCH